MENVHPLLCAATARPLTETAFLRQHLCMKFLYQSEQPYWELTVLGAWKVWRWRESEFALCSQKDGELLQRLRPSSFTCAEYITQQKSKLLPLVLIGSLMQHWETSQKRSWEWTTSDTLWAYSFTDIPANAFKTSSRLSSSQLLPFLYGNSHVSVTSKWLNLGICAFKCCARVPLTNVHSLYRQH